MKKVLLLHVLLIIACSKNTQIKNPRIAIIGLGIESSTFSPATTSKEAFHAKRGVEIFDKYPFLHKDSLTRNRAEWLPILVGKALPGGIVTSEAYESLVKESLEMLKQNGPYDGVFFDIHGAMSVVGIDDAEGDLIARVRDIVGFETLISTSMDLHGNVSKLLAMQSDLITCYRMAPHEDAIESKKRAVTNLLDRLINKKGKPAYKAWVPVPILLPGEKTSTRIEPGKSLYEQIPLVTQNEGIVDAAIWVGYPWADEFRNHAVVMVTGDNKKAVISGAEKLANQFWESRNDFKFVAPTTTLDESLKLALKSKLSPFIISDMGDNPTAGGAGDVTYTLNQLLSRSEFKHSTGPSLIYASIPGPDLIKKALDLEVGSFVEGYVGAIVDDRYSPPILLSGKITSIKKGDINAEVEVVVKTGSISVIVTNKRKPYHYLKDFTDLKLDPINVDILMVKIGYLVPELYEIRGDWVMALTPGGVDQDLERLKFKRIKRPMFPFDKDMTKPDLSARLIELSNKK